MIFQNVFSLCVLYIIQTTKIIWVVVLNISFFASFGLVCGKTSLSFLSYIKCAASLSNWWQLLLQLFYSQMLVMLQSESHGGRPVRTAARCVYPVGYSLAPASHGEAPLQHQGGWRKPTAPIATQALPRTELYFLHSQQPGKCLAYWHVCCYKHLSRIVKVLPCANVGREGVT